MKYNALAIKNWIISSISPFGWAILISRCLPELLEVNPNFSATYVGKNTRWDETELSIIQWYLRKLYNTEIPESILWQNGNLKGEYIDLITFDFFTQNKTFTSFRKSLLNFLKF